MYTAILIKFIPASSTRPARLKASTLSDRPTSATISYHTDAADSEDGRYAVALQTLLTKMGDGWGDGSAWVAGHTNMGRIYVLPARGAR